jgi:hypothetical protein
MFRGRLSAEDGPQNDNDPSKERAMHPSIAHAIAIAIASGIQEPAWLLSDPASNRPNRAWSPPRPSGPGIRVRLRDLVRARRAHDGEWMPGVVPQVSGYPTQR